MLHEDRPAVMLNQIEEVSDDNSVKETAAERMSMISAEHFFHTAGDSMSVLATALIPVVWNGRSIVLRALIDQGSTANLITNRACQALKLQQKRFNIPMVGVGNSPVGTVLAKTMFTFDSIHDASYRHDVESIVVKSISDSREIDVSSVKQWHHIKRLVLADPQFFEANKIDLLLGAAAYAEILLGEIKKGRVDEPTAQHTKLGWIVFGTACANNDFKLICNAVNGSQTSTVDVASLLQRFWQLEEVTPIKNLTPEEQAAEDVFVSTVKRDDNGCFVVDLPFKADPSSECLECQNR